MTPNVRISPRPLTVYPYRHRDSQCYSCSTVTPGDICFNCGRLSTLLVTPRPPRKSAEQCTPAMQCPAPVRNKQQPLSNPFDCQFDRIECLISAQERATQACLKQRAFNCQLTEVDDLLDARKKLAPIHTLVAEDTGLVGDRDLTLPQRHFTRSSKHFASSSTAQSVCSSWSPLTRLRSGSSAISDILDEDGRPHVDVVARWLEGMKPLGMSEAKITRKGMECCLKQNGTVCEWVVFL